MSRGYQVAWTTVSSTVSGSDSLEVGTCMLGILSEGEMRDLLRAELQADGWQKQEDGTYTKQVGGEKGVPTATAVLSADGAKITVTQTVTTDVQARGQNRAQAAAQLDQAEEQAKERLGVQATQALVKIESELRPQLEEATRRVYVEALKKKAASMGTIESVVEQGGDVTIKIRA